jgi:hypothetical protein
LIQAFSEYPWTAIKISSHVHTDSDAEDCVFSEEKKPGGISDSSRFLAAGAVRSFWVGVREGRIQEAMPRLWPVLNSPFVLLESNGILRHVEPDLYIMVVCYAVTEFKDSARETLDKAHAIIAVGGESSSPPWRDLLKEKAAGIPLFPTPDPRIIPPGLLELVRSRLPSRL